MRPAVAPPRFTDLNDEDEDEDEDEDDTPGFVEATLASSVAIHARRASSGASFNMSPTNSMMAPVVKIAVGSASPATARNRGNVRARRIGSGGYAGTAMTPDDKHA
jgi:hypothetical protein